MRTPIILALKKQCRLTNSGEGTPLNISSKTSINIFFYVGGLGSVDRGVETPYPGPPPQLPLTQIEGDESRTHTNKRARTHGHKHKHTEDALLVVTWYMLIVRGGLISTLCMFCALEYVNKGWWGFFFSVSEYHGVGLAWFWLKLFKSIFKRLYSKLFF